MPELNCPICGHGEAGWVRSARGYEVSCNICGGGEPFVIGTTLMSQIQSSDFTGSPDARLARHLSAYIRQHGRLTRVILTSENWKELAEGVRSISVVIKIEKLLGLIADESSYVGAPVRIVGDLDYPLANAANREELHFMLEHLQSTELIELTKEDVPGVFRYVLRVLTKGWEKLQSHDGNNCIPGRCFVAMSFAPEMLKVYDEGIAGALTECGLEPRMLARIHHNDDINDKILAELRAAELVVAEFTKQRGGVYFEAGFTKALGREVIWCCQKSEEKELHFDTRQFNFIFWTTPGDLKEKLIDRIRGTGFARKLA